MGKLCIGMLVVLCSVTTRGSDLKITDFVPSSYRGYGLKTYFDGGYSWYSDFACVFELMPFYRMYGDTTEWNTTLNIHGHGRSFDNGDFGITVRLFSDIRQYMWRSNVFVYGSVEPTYWLDSGVHEWFHSIYGNARFGSGYGRIREGQYIAVALRISDILKREYITTDDLSDSTIYEIARILAQEPKFMLDHDRYIKYLLKELAQIFVRDSAMHVEIPVYTWFEITDLASRYRYSNPAVSYWQRRFGDRFGVYFTAFNISQVDPLCPRRQFPLYRDYDYSPYVEFIFEHEKPIGLNRQFSFESSIRIDWTVESQYCRWSNGVGYEWGLIDRFLLGANLSTDYILDPDTVLHRQHTIMVYPSITCTYFIEDRLALRIRSSLDISLSADSIDDRDSYETTVHPGFYVATDWRIF